MSQGEAESGVKAGASADEKGAIGKNVDEKSVDQKSVSAGGADRRGRRNRDRAINAGLAVLLMGLGLAAGPLTLAPTPPEPPKFASAALLRPVTQRDASVPATLKARSTVQIAANLRRLAPPETPTETIKHPVSTETHPAPEVEVTVDVSDQRATVVVNGVQTGYYKVSTGLGRSWTPRGTYPPKWLSRHHRSSIYNNAPMPYSVFFNGNIALHGTNQIRKLGRPASKGCVRMHPASARKIFNLVYRHGRDKVQITVQD